jgi:hypothetical protein
MNLYKETPFGLERINEKDLTPEEADAMRRMDPLLLSKVKESNFSINVKFGLALTLLVLSLLFAVKLYCLNH